MDKWTLGNKEFTSRFILGSGKYAPGIDAAVECAGAEMITVALRRANTADVKNILDYIPEEVTIIPNTSGARNADEAIRIARLAKEMGCGNFVKIEIMRDSKYLLPRQCGNLKGHGSPRQRGLRRPALYVRISTMPGICATPEPHPLCPWPPLSEAIRDFHEDFIKIIVDGKSTFPSSWTPSADLPVAEAMEMGVAAIMANTGIATASNITLMAEAFKGNRRGCKRLGYLSKPGRVLDRGADPSSPLRDFFE